MWQATQCVPSSKQAAKSDGEMFVHVLCLSVIVSGRWRMMCFCKVQIKSDKRAVHAPARTLRAPFGHLETPALEKGALLLARPVPRFMTTELPLCPASPEV